MGSPGNDTITLIGAAESDDVIDLDNGLDILALDNVANNLFVEGAETIVGGTMTDTVTLQGNLNSLGGIITNAAGPNAIETIINDGFIEIFDETTAATNGDFQNTGFGHIQLGGSVGSDITFETFSSQHGNIFLMSSLGNRWNWIDGSQRVRNMRNSQELRVVSEYFLQVIWYQITFR